MGFFGSFLYAGGTWSAVDPSSVGEVPVPALLVAVHDSDLAFVQYLPVGPGSGTAYLGYTPRVYFADDGASPPTDVPLEAASLAMWWAAVHGRGVDEAEAKAVDLLPFLASDDPDDEDDEGDEDDDVFVETRLRRFLEVLGVPVPDEVFDEA